MDPNLPDLLVWVDIETTGLDPNRDSILEVGLAITDPLGDSPDRWSDIPVWSMAVSVNVERLKAEVDPLVLDMHTNSGLWVECSTLTLSGQFSAAEAYVVEDAAVRWLTEMGVIRGAVPMCGSSVHFDRAFLSNQMPDLAAHFHYRNLDTSTIKNVCRYVNPSVYDAVPEKKNKHRALPDIRESIDEYKFYLDNLIHVAL